MELYQLQYFIAAATTENLQRASKLVHASPAALSKAISSLETELGVSLFARRGRNLHLTPEGELAQKRAAQVFDLLTTMKVELAPKSIPLTVRIAGPEYLLAEYGVKLAHIITGRYPEAKTIFTELRTKDAFSALEQNSIDFSLTVARPPDELLTQKLAEFDMVVCWSKNHILHKKGPHPKQFKHADIEQYSFVAPGQIISDDSIHLAIDGWPENLRRQISWQSLSAAIIRELVHSGQALAYVPKFWADAQNFHSTALRPLKASFPVYLTTAKNPVDSWRHKLMKERVKL